MTVQHSLRDETAKVSAVEVESSSRPGLFHEVTLNPDSCNCEATISVCRHVRQARVRASKASGVCCCISGWGYIGYTDDYDVERAWPPTAAGAAASGRS